MKQRSLGLPRHLFGFSLVVGLLVPFLARLPSVPARGWEWFADYLPSVGGVLFLSAFNLIPAGVLYGLGQLSKRAPLAFWVALSGGLAFLLWAHGTVNLRSSSTAAIALMFIPIVATGAVAAGWGLGWLAHAIAKDDRIRLWIAGLAIVIGIAAGAGAGIYQSRSIAEREARFPVIAVKHVPLTRRQVHPCCLLGSVEVLALGNFDSEPGNDIAVLGASGVALLSPVNYAVKFKATFAHESCDGCIRMYPYVVADGKGGLLIASSAGVADSRGHRLWALKARGFTRLVPIQVSPGNLTFFSYQNNDRADLHGPDGKVLWSVKLPASNVGVYVTADGTRFPFAIGGHGKSRYLRLYDNAGNPKRTIHLPERTSEIESIAWPKPGHWLAGGGDWIGVLAPDGREVLRHVIRGTSFDPYHGPDGTVVRFKTSDEPYLAVMSHGSSGYARSVLLLFDSKSRLVWQEEMNEVRTILAAPRADRGGDVLLLGGMDGVVEYSLTRTSGKR